MAVMNRWLVIASEGGSVQNVEPFSSLKKAKSRADELGPQMNPERDDVVVWDLVLGRAGYNPLRGLDIY
jgi:hypothetical protein